MKLLTKTSRYYVVFSVILFLIGGIIFYHLLKSIFYHQIDENLKEEKLLIEETINHSDSIPDFRSVFGHMIEVTILNKPRQKFEIIKDTSRYDTASQEINSFRFMRVENTSWKRKGYVISIYKSLRESKNLIEEIIGAVILLFLALLIMLILVNYVVVRRAWVPFYRTLASLRLYDINQDNPLRLAPTNISEFRLLNDSLKKMSDKIRYDFLNLKEFNENASHELQTPLAVIKSKLDLLIQEETLSKEQLQLITSIYESITRMSKLNQGLLLISKIENNQFPEEEELSLKQVMEKQIGQYEEMLDHKKISLAFLGNDPLLLKMNRVLGDILISNLLSNAVKHNIPGGRIEIRMDPGNLSLSNTGLPLQVDPDKLFERFRKGNRESESIGLGLAIVNKICNLYRIRVIYRFSEGIHTIELHI